MTSNIHTYLHQVSKSLCCKSNEEVAILAKLQHDIEAYQAVYPDRKFCDIVAFFGTPEETAKRYMKYLAECVEYERIFFQITTA